MQRCVYLHDSGGQCTADALIGSDFCADHIGRGFGSDPETGDVAGLERLDDHPMRKLVIRLVALILLVLFLVPFYFTLKALYLGPPPQAQEGW